MRLILMTWLFILVASSVGYAQLRINEAVSSNGTQLDEDGDTPDWLEIYNTGDVVSLAGYTLSDNADEPGKWTFGESVIGAGDYLVVWASGKDRPENGTGAPHTNFRISASGETLYLFTPDGALASRLALPALPRDVSFGYTVAGGMTRVFTTPTPGSENLEDGPVGALTSAPVFGSPGGPQMMPLAVNITPGEPGTTIRYTTDATEPTPQSTEYTAPFIVSENTVVRARAFRENYRPSPVASQTYLFGAEHDLDVVTLIVEPDEYFGPDGIYVLGPDYEGDFPFFGSNIWEDREVTTHFSLYPRNGEIFQQTVGTKIFGGWSRGHAQRSLSVFARGRYGDGDMNYPFFPNRPFGVYESLVLRNSGNDWMRSMQRDATTTQLMEGSGVAVQAHRPVVVYLNGRYWGIYNLREKINEDYLASHYGVDPDAVDILERDGQIIEGDNDDYLALLRFCEENDLRQPAAYRHVAERVDLDNFIKYQLAQIYIDNQDWPGNNFKFWRSEELDGKWRWFLFDTDYGTGLTSDFAAANRTLEFATEPNGPGWPNPPWGTLMLRKLLNNQEFRHRFINQFADEMNTRFLPDTALALLDRNVARIAGEIPRAFARWDNDGSFENNVRRMELFFAARPGNMKAQLLDYFGLTAYHPVTVRNDDTTAGYVELNSLRLDGPTWTGDYFSGVPFRLKAVPRDGFAFSHWAANNLGAVAEIYPNVLEPTTFRPVWKLEDGTSSAGEPVSNLEFIQDLVLSPNPADDYLRMAFQITRGTRVRATLIDPLGREAEVFFDQELNAGVHLRTLSLQYLPPGVYHLHLTEKGGGEATLSVLKR